MSLHFYAYARKGYEFIDDVATALHLDDTDKAGRLTRCVFRALRNQLSMEDSFRLVAHLPMALKAVYVDGWKINPKPEDEKISSDIISEVVREDANSAWRDFSNHDEVKNVVLGVFKVLLRHVGELEMTNLIAVLPPLLRKELLEDIKLA